MSRSLQERVAGAYYAHGLYCSSHPVLVISLAIFVILACCYPLVNLPMPGNAPRTVINHTILSSNGSDSSALYIQQVVLRVGIVPWADDLAVSDAFRGPLYEVFNLLEIIQNYQDPESLKTLGQICLHIEAVKKRNAKKPEILPEYNCLVLSPANLWQQSVEIFQQDTDLLGTIFSYQSLQKGKISLAEMVFGMNLKETGVKRYPIRVRQRVLQYAVTIFMKTYDPRFISGLKSRLTSYYPLHQSKNANIINTEETLHIFYPGAFNYSDFFPLTMTFVALFFYVYFSVRKMELIKSKVGMAFSASFTVISSLAMTVGVCFFFGLTLSLTSKDIFPYLVVIVGLENVLVITKSVVSTPPNLDVKIRVARGMYQEGWSITKNLLTEVTILTIGLFTFVPAIQEFCIFAIVGLLNDFFLQIVFFSTILAVDIRRMELSTENSKFHLPQIPATRKTQFATITTKISDPKRNIFRSKSHPRLNGLSTDVIAATAKNVSKTPKRLRLVDFWATTRIFQRAFMVWMVVWISMIIYNCGIIQHLINLSDTLKPETEIDSYTIDRPQNIKSYVGFTNVKPMSIQTSTQTPDFVGEQQKPLENNITEELNKLRPVDFPPWNRLSLYHWSSILTIYNISVAGEHITILPAIKISHAVTPQLVRQISNPNDIQLFQWKSFASAALDPLDFSDVEVPTRSEARSFNTNTPFIPTSPMEIFFAALLCLISVIVVAYTMVVLYRCICTRNYAEWRASWHQQEKNQDSGTQFVLETRRLVLEGHAQEVECIATDGNTIASTCLAGHIKIWDSMSGELISHIDRKKSFKNVSRDFTNGTPDPDELMSDYESGSPPSREEIETGSSFGTKNANFTSQRLNFSDFAKDSCKISNLSGEIDSGSSFGMKNANFTSQRLNFPVLNPGNRRTTSEFDKQRNSINSFDQEEKINEFSDFSKEIDTGNAFGTQNANLKTQRLNFSDFSKDSCKISNLHGEIDSGSCFTTQNPNSANQRLNFSDFTKDSCRNSNSREDIATGSSFGSQNANSTTQRLNFPVITSGNHRTASEFDNSVDQEEKINEFSDFSKKIDTVSGFGTQISNSLGEIDSGNIFGSQNANSTTQQLNFPVLTSGNRRTASEFDKHRNSINSVDQEEKINEFSDFAKDSCKISNSRGEIATGSVTAPQYANLTTHRLNFPVFSSENRRTASEFDKHRNSINSVDQEEKINEFSDFPKDFSRISRRSFDQSLDGPDLQSSINTRFSTQQFSPSQTNYQKGFDYGEKYKRVFEEYRKSVDFEKFENAEELNFNSQRDFKNSSSLGAFRTKTATTSQTKNVQSVSPIWCVDYQDNLIVVGCANGSLEFWEGTTGNLKCLFDDGSGLGTSAVKFAYNRVIAAKLNGSVDFLELERYSEGHHVGWGFTSGRRTHVRTGSAGSPMDLNNFPRSGDDLRCLKKGSHRAHQQAITVLDSEGGHVVTGSQDHTLKVISLVDQVPVYTLHGHCGPISCLFIDRFNPMSSGSGSRDGLLCVWDLSTGMCMYSTQAHDGAVAALTCSASYIISIGTDERLCVWERFQGHLLHALPAQRASYSFQLVMLTEQLLITSNQGSLVVWDVRTGEQVREVRLGHKDDSVYVKQMLALGDSIVCDFGRQLRIVRFASVSDKRD